MGHEIPGDDDGQGYRRPPYRYDPYSSESAHAFFRYDAPPRPCRHVPAVDGSLTASDFHVMMEGANHDSIVRNEAIMLWTRIAIRTLVMRGDAAAISDPDAIITLANDLRRDRGLPPLPT